LKRIKRGSLAGSIILMTETHTAKQIENNGAYSEKKFKTF